MNEVLCRYLSKKAIDDLRNNKQLDEDLADALNSYPLLDCQRKHIIIEDKGWLKSLASSSQSHIAELCINLMHPLREEKDIKELLFDLWESSSSKYNIKMQIMWRILDYEEISEEMHKSIYSFVRSNWEKWINYVVEKFGGKNKVLESCQERLQNPAFPKSKAWVYLCIAVGSDNTVEAKNLIENYINSKASINTVVAKDLLNIIE
jgi:hypothetical protein